MIPSALTKGVVPMLGRKKLKADFCVVGGGISGICAAIAAAREGAKVVLMQDRPMLGGNASSEIRMWVCGAHGSNNRETGILEEISLESLRTNPTKNYYLWDLLLYTYVRREKNITLLLNCSCLDASVETGEYAYGRTRRITSITGWQTTTQTYYDVEARFFADCSGDSILAPLTGAEYMLGREDHTVFNEDTHVEKTDSMTMGMSCLVYGRETTRRVPYTAPEWAAKLTDEDFRNREPDIYNPDENFWYLELGGNRDSIHDTQELNDELLGLAAGTWDYVKNSGKFRAENWEMDFLGFLPGKRESRRMRGELVITQRDISDCVAYPDTVAFGGWPIDDHYPAGFYHRGTPNTDIHTPAPYPIPYRALYSKNVDNLFFAGRNISASHMALSSARVMATCGLMGQAVGVAAAIAASMENACPHDVYTSRLDSLQEKLMDADCFLPGFERRVSEDCRACRSVPDSLKDGRDRQNRIYGMEPCGELVKNGEKLEYSFDSPVEVQALHIVFDSDLDRMSLPGNETERKATTRACVLLDSPVMHMPGPLCRNFDLEIETESGVEKKTVTDNILRAYHLPVGKKVKRITLTPYSNWGGGTVTRVFSFDFK